jgi:hypothetical protein
MSTYDDRDTAITREPGLDGGQHTRSPQYRQPYQQPYGYGQPYGRRFGRGGGMTQGGWSETKPFFMASEFIATLVCVLGICIVAAVAEDLDSHLASVLITALVAAYTISRGIAKAGTRSRATDPRDDMQFGRTHDGQ